MQVSKRLIGSISALRALLREMETSAGLDSLPRAERDVLCAAYEAGAFTDGSFSSEAIRQIPIAREMSLPTYHRALRNLVEKGYLSHAPGRKRGAYILR